MPHVLLGAFLAAATLVGRPAQTGPADPPDPPSGPGVTPVHYELSVDLDYEQEILHGRARITVQNNAREPVREVPLVLYRLMEVTAARDEAGDSLAFDQRVVRDPDLPTLQLDQVRVALAAPLPPGARTTIEVRYEGYLLGYAETGMRYIKDRIDPAFTILRDDAWAFPRVGYASIAAERAAVPASYDYLARITVPDTLVVANGGRLLERTVQAGRATYTYRSDRPSWRMDFAIGDYGRLETGPVRILYLRRDSAGAARVARAAASALELFAGMFGALPDDRALTFIEIEDGYGSQTDAATILQAAASFRDSTRNYEIYHEVSHLWNPPETDRPGPRWNEGLAQFLQSLATERLTGRPALDRDAGQVLQWLAAHAADNPRWRTVPLVDYGKAGMTDLSYRVGALFFHLLYRRVGPDGFDAIIGGFSRQYATTGASTEQFVRYAQAHAAVDLAPLFADWFQTTRWVDLVREVRSFPELRRRYGA
jgi:aminopeptidase N